jgi:hypothetical protein
MWLLTTMAALLSALLLHVVACRVRPAAPVTMLLLVGALVGGLLTAALVVTATALETFAALVVFALGIESYLFLHGTAANSIGVGLLLRLAERELSLADVRTLYDTHGMVQRRLARLEDSGLIAAFGNGYRVTPKGRRLLALFLWFRKVFRHPGQGYFGTLPTSVRSLR